MYVQIRMVRNCKYVYVVENRRRKSDGKIVRKTIDKLGKLDDLLKKDPLFIEHLKATLKNKGEIAKSEQRLYENLTIKAQENELSANLNNGYQFIYYANEPLKRFWDAYLNLHYYFKYLQRKYYRDLAFNIEEKVFHMMLEYLIPEAFTLKRSNAFFNEKVDLIHERSTDEECKEIIFNTRTRFEKYIKRLDRVRFPWYQTVAKEYDSLCAAIKTNLDKDSYIAIFKHILKQSFLYCINHYLSRTHKVSSLSVIEEAIQNSKLIRIIPLDKEKNETVYIKIAHKTTKIMDAITLIVGMDIVDNCQSERELIRKLRYRKKDLDIENIENEFEYDNLDYELVDQSKQKEVEEESSISFVFGLRHT